MFLRRMIALVLSLLMMVAIVGCSGAPMSTREESTLWAAPLVWVVVP